MKLDRRIIVSLAVGVFLAGGAFAWTQLRPKPQPAATAAEGITIAHRQGRTVVAPAPETVLVYDPAILDTLDALGVKVTGVAGGPFPRHLAKYGAPPYVQVGTLFEADMEKVATLEPDLIVVGGRSSRQYEALSKIAPTIDLTGGRGDYIETTIQTTQTLGRLFGREDRANALSDRLRQSVASVKAKAATAGKGLVLLTTGGRMSAYGPEAESRYGFIYSSFGVVPAVDKLKTGAHGNSVTAEFVRQVDPDWILVIDRDTAIGRTAGGGGGAEPEVGPRAPPQADGQRNRRGGRQEGPAMSARQTLDNPLINQTKAWKRGQVVYLDPVAWYITGGGVQNAQRMTQEMADAFDKAAATSGGDR